MSEKRLLKQLRASEKRLSDERDKLREIVSEYEQLAEKVDSALIDINNAIDTLSELVLFRAIGEE